MTWSSRAGSRCDALFATPAHDGRSVDEDLVFVAEPVGDVRVADAFSAPGFDDGAELAVEGAVVEWEGGLGAHAIQTASGSASCQAPCNRFGVALRDALCDASGDTHREWPVKAKRKEPTMKPRTAWIEARNAAGLTQRDVDFWMRQRLPNAPDLRVAQEKLSRFEKGGLAKIGPASLALLAECYGTTLRDIDNEAAEAYKTVRDLVIAIPACESMNAGIAA